MMRRLHRTDLLFIGWGLFLLSCVLPVSTNSLMDPERPHRGITHVFYSILSIYLMLAQINWSDKKEVFYIVGYAIIGLIHLLMFIAPVLLLVKGARAQWLRWMMAFAALYICVAGFLLLRNLHLLYGFYVWCLSFVIVAAAMWKKPDDANVVAG